MLRPRVVTPNALTTLLSRHSSFQETNVVEHLSPIICNFAFAFRIRDIIHHLMPVFDGWRRITTFHPKPTHPANVTYPYNNPVREYTRFGGRMFFRERHSAGVTFATFVPLGGREVGVVWTTARKAHIFHYENGSWDVVKTLNRQDVPYQTWIRFLGGREVSMQEHEHTDRSSRRSLSELFRDLVFPFYGSTPHARNSLYERSIHPDHPTWDIVRVASHLTVPLDHPSRLVWHRMCA